MAFAAVHSLWYTIDNIVNFRSIEGILRPAWKEAWSLKTTFENCRKWVTEMDEQIIIEEARRLEDAIDFAASTHVLLSQDIDIFSSLNLHHLTQDADRFVKTAKERKQSIEEHKIAKMTEEDDDEEEEEDDDDDVECDMVGLSDAFEVIKDKLAAKPLVWISGMAGIGKTTLAKRVYNDPSVKANFECRAFVRVGQGLKLKQLLQAIIAQLNLENEITIMEGDDDADCYGHLFECLGTILTLRKSLIALDDVWEHNICNYLVESGIQYMGSKGTRVLVTSRNDYRQDNYIFSLKVRFLNEEESWELLKRKVFGCEEEEEEAECPYQLERAGRKIAEKCEGLPLLIIAVAPILVSKAQKNLERWIQVAEKPGLVLEDASDQISEVLLKSYHAIREETKLCYLYIAAFPLNYVVRSSKIIHLWHAERLLHIIFDENFLSNVRSSHLGVFGQLHKRNLVIYKTDEDCSLHCAYWYVSKKVAENNKFLHIIESYEDGLDECVRSHRRLAIHSNVLLAMKEVHNSIATISTVRSLLCTGPYHQYQVPMCWEWKLLRVLDALTIRFYEFPVEVVKLLLLRYLGFTCNANISPSISKLRSLEYLIIHQHLSIKRVVAAESYAPVEIWDLPALMHLQIMGRNLPDPPPEPCLSNLTELLDVGVESCTKRVLTSIPLLQRLRIQIELAPHAAQSMTMRCFHHLSCLEKLESFQCVVMNPALLPSPPPLSISAPPLEELILNGFGYAWNAMNKIARLHDLRVLKLQCYAFRGEKWDAKAMKFESLEYLCIEDTNLVQWTAGDETFPELSRLSMKNCHKLREIPRISTICRDDDEVLDIELVDCNPLAETCAKERYDDERVQIRASYSWKEEKPKY